MAVFTSVTTVSHAYYAKKSKFEIIRRIEEMRRALDIDPYNADELIWLRQQTNSKLAFVALEHHDKFPE